MIHRDSLGTWLAILKLVVLIKRSGEQRTLSERKSLIEKQGDGATGVCEQKSWKVMVRNVRAVAKMSQPSSLWITWAMTVVGEIDTIQSEVWRSIDGWFVRVSLIPSSFFVGTATPAGR